MNLVLPPYGDKDGQPSYPSCDQVKFHAAADRGVRFCYFRGGLGSGKSWAGAWEFLRRILKNRAEYQRRGKSGELVYVAMAPTYQLIDAGAWTHLLTLLDEISRLNGFSIIKGKPQRTHPRQIRLTTGDVIKFIATDAWKFAGQNVAGVWLDEGEESENPREAFKLGRKRLRDARSPHLFYLVTSTPSVEGQGISRLFDEQGDDPNYVIVTGSTKNNPGIDRDYHDELRATMSEAEVLAFLEGKPQPPTGTVFAREFDRVASVAHNYQFRKERLSKGSELILAIDWGGHYYCAFIEHIDGVDYVFDEVYVDGVQDVEFLDMVCARLKKKWSLSRRDVHRVYCDAQPHTAVRLAWSARYFQGKVFKRRTDEKRKRDGIQAVKFRLRDADGKRRLFLAPKLRADKGRGLYRSLMTYQFKKRVIDGAETVLDKVNQESWSSHACDAIRYYVAHRYRHQTLREKAASRT